MSSFRATLELGGKEYDVLYSNYDIVLFRFLLKRGGTLLSYILRLLSLELLNVMPYKPISF